MQTSEPFFPHTVSMGNTRWRQQQQLKQFCQSALSDKSFDFPSTDIAIANWNDEYVFLQLVKRPRFEVARKQQQSSSNGREMENASANGNRIHTHWALGEQMSDMRAHRTC